MCVRFGALVWLLYTISHLNGLFAYVEEGAPIQIDKTVVVLFAALQIGVCVFLWLFPRSVAAQLLPGRNTDEVVKPSSQLEWQTLGVICIGLWALSRAIPDAVYWITFYNMAASSKLGLSFFNAEQKAAMLSTVAELAIGVWLLLGAKGTAAFIFKARTAGATK